MTRVRTRFTIRGATPADANSIAELSGSLGYPVSVATMRSRIERVIASVADLLNVAEDDSGFIAGWLQAHATPTVESGFRVEIIGLIVSQKWRRHGIGRRLVAETERWAVGMSAETIVVRSNAQRAESHHFYPALGYLEAKTQIVYRKPLKAVNQQVQAATDDALISPANGEQSIHWAGGGSAGS